MLVRLLTLACSALVAGCTASSCDPSQAGFFSGIGCEGSGAYTQRNQAQQTQLAASRSATLSERANAAQAEDAAYSSQFALNAKRQRLQVLDQQNSALQRRLAAAQANNRVDQAQLASAQAQLADLQYQRASLSVSSTDTSVRDYEQKQQKMLSIITDMSNL